jgi:hypothetical protein
MKMTNGRERIKQALDGAAFQRKPLNGHDAAINMQLMLDVADAFAYFHEHWNDIDGGFEDYAKIGRALERLDRVAV